MNGKPPSQPVRPLCLRCQAAKDRGQLASPSSEQASWDQLDYDTVEGLLEKGKGFAVQV